MPCPTHPSDLSSAERLHQEDFCQAQGIVPEHKYQKEGGPSLKQCFALLRDVSSAPVVDLSRLLDAVIYILSGSSHVVLLSGFHAPSRPSGTSAGGFAHGCSTSAS